MKRFAAAGLALSLAAPAIAFEHDQPPIRSRIGAASNGPDKIIKLQLMADVK